MRTIHITMLNIKDLGTLNPLQAINFHHEQTELYQRLSLYNSYCHVLSPPYESKNKLGLYFVPKEL
jgi:hypothetical protein